MTFFIASTTSSFEMSPSPSLSAVAEVAMRAQVKRLAIFHHDPLHPDRMVDELVLKTQRYLQARGSTIDCFGAREGMVLKV